VAWGLRKSFFWKDKYTLVSLSKFEIRKVTWGPRECFFGREKSTLELGIRSTKQGVNLESRNMSVGTADRLCFHFWDEFLR
jgi:hypothetical protein